MDITNESSMISLELTKRPKKLFWFLALVVFVVASGGTYASAKYYQSNKLVKQADQLVKDGKYAEALTKYDQAKTDWHWLKIETKKMSTTTLKQLQDYADQGNADLAVADWQGCVDALAKVTSRSPQYAAVQSHYLVCKAKLTESSASATQNATSTTTATPTPSTSSTKSTSTPKNTASTTPSSTATTTPAATAPTTTPADTTPSKMEFDSQPLEADSYATLSTRLGSCSKYRSQWTMDVFSVIYTVGREVFGIVNNKCNYLETMPNNGRLECKYSDSERTVVAQYYADLANGTFDGKTYTIDGKTTDNPLQVMSDSGVCVTSGY